MNDFYHSDIKPKQKNRLNGVYYRHLSEFWFILIKNNFEFNLKIDLLQQISKLRYFRS